MRVRPPSARHSVRATLLRTSLSPGSAVATIIVDSGLRYLSSDVFQSRPGALAMIPAALPLMLAMRVPRFSTPLWAGIQRRLYVGDRIGQGEGQTPSFDAGRAEHCLD